MSTARATFGSRSSLPARVGRVALLGAAVLFVAFVVFSVGAGALFWPVLAMFGMAAVAVAAFRWPTHAALSMLLLVPLSRFISFGVFAATGSGLAVRASQLVKDEVLVFVVLGAVNLAVLRRQSPRLHILDIAVLAYIAIVLVYLLYPGVDGSSSSVFGRVLAFRQDAFFILAYFVGRGVTLSRDHAVVGVRVMVALSIAIGLFAAFQWMLPGLSNGVLHALGFPAFMAEIGAPHEALAVRSRGIGAADLPRASSFFLADLGLAFYQLLAIPFAAALFLFARTRGGQSGYALFLLLMIGALGMTVTRSAIVAAVLGIAVVFALRPSFARFTVVAAGVLAACAGFVLLEGLDGDTLATVFSLDDGSARAHLTLIGQALETVQEHPTGLGLGNGSHVANLLATYGVTLAVAAAESWYLQIGLEMGIAGMLAFVAMLLGATFYGFAAYFRVQDELLRVLALTTTGAGVSLVAIGAFHPVWSATHVTFFFWLLAGIAVRAPRLEREWRETADASPEAS